jgi:hypothetical protein
MNRRDDESKQRTHNRGREQTDWQQGRSLNRQRKRFSAEEATDGVGAVCAAHGAKWRRCWPGMGSINGHVSPGRFHAVLPHPPSKLTPPTWAFRQPIPVRVVPAVNPPDDFQNEPGSEPKSADGDEQLRWPDYWSKYGSKSE